MKILELSISLKFIYFNVANIPSHIQILIKLEIADFFSISKYVYKTCIHPIKSPEISAHVLFHTLNLVQKKLWLVLFVSHISIFQNQRWNDFPPKKSHTTGRNEKSHRGLEGPNIRHIFFCQITTFIKVHVAIIFLLQTL